MLLCGCWLWQNSECCDFEQMRGCMLSRSVFYHFLRFFFCWLWIQLKKNYFSEWVIEWWCYHNVDLSLSLKGLDLICYCNLLSYSYMRCSNWLGVYLGTLNMWWVYSQRLPPPTASDIIVLVDHASNFNAAWRAW